MSRKFVRPGDYSAAVALDSQKAVLQQSALEVVLELLANEFWQVAAGLFDFLDEAWVVFSKDGVESGLFRAVPVVSGNSGGNGSKKHRTWNA